MSPIIVVDSRFAGALKVQAQICQILKIGFIQQPPNQQKWCHMPLNSSTVAYSKKTTGKENQKNWDRYERGDADSVHCICLTPGFLWSDLSALFSFRKWPGSSTSAGCSHIVWTSSCLDSKFYGTGDLHISIVAYWILSNRDISQTLTITDSCLATLGTQESQIGVYQNVIQYIPPKHHDVSSCSLWKWTCRGSPFFDEAISQISYFRPDLLGQRVAVVSQWPGGGWPLAGSNFTQVDAFCNWMPRRFFSARVNREQMQ